MSTLTQRIPTLLLGISQQPDTLKFPGQVVEADNVFPDYALGMLKRPGGKFEATLKGASTSGKWFPILRDANEKYVAQYDNNTFRVWSLLDGSPRKVEMGTAGSNGIPSGCNYTNLQADLLVYNTEVSDVSDELEDLNEFGAVFAETNDGQKSTTSSSLDIRTTYTDDYVQTVRTGVVYNGTNYTITDDGTVIDHGTNTSPTSAPFTFTGTYTRVGTAITVTSSVNHGFQTGHEVKLEFTSGNGTSATYRITKTSDTVFTLTDPLSGNTSGNVTIHDTYQLGADRTEDYPLLKRQGLKVYELETQTPATHTAAQLTTATNNLTQALTDYNTAVTNEGTAETNYDSEVTDCAIASIPGATVAITAAGTGFAASTTTNNVTAASATSGATGMVFTITTNASGEISAATITTDPGTYLDGDVITLTGFAGASLTYSSAPYLNGATADDLEILTVNDYTFVLNKARETRMRAPLTGWGLQQRQGFIVISIVAYNANYSAVFNGSVATYTTATDTSVRVEDANTIANGLAGQINNIAGISAQVVGPGIYFTYTAGASPLTFSTRGSSGEEGLYGFLDQINVSGRLPNQCVNNYRVKVYNSDIVDADDMWVRFVTTNNTSSGPGVWEECPAPEIRYEIDAKSMPHQLVRQSDGSFKFDPINWTDRLVGDDTTNPIPSFIGEKINDIFFYRNRLGFLSREAIILSKAGDYFNFFAGSAQLVAADDPIDITATSRVPVNLNYAKPTSVGLVLFSQNEQFLLSTDADILGPTTAKINTLSNFECDEDLEAVSMGTTLAFVSKTLLWSRLFELNNIRKEAPADSVEFSNNVSELVPATINSLIASPALSIVSMGQTGTNTLYQYRFYQVGNERLANTWYKWTLAGNLRDQFFDETTFYAVCDDGTNVFVQSYDLTQSAEEGFLTLPTGEKTDVCMDMFNVNPRRTYTANTDVTRIHLPYTKLPNRDDDLCVVVLGGYIGQTVSATDSIGSVLTGASLTHGAGFVDVAGDYRGRNLIIGYLYDMTIQLPKFYFGKTEGKQHVSDSAADLIIHRLKVNTGLSGPITYSVDITGRSDWENVVNVTLPNSYTLGNVNLSASSEHIVPVFQRNTNLKITIKGDTAFPVSINSLSWEGNYNTRFYRRS